MHCFAGVGESTPSSGTKPQERAEVSVGTQIQESIQKRLKAACEETESSGGWAVVLEPKEHTVLAAASYPVGDSSGANPALTNLFEPGSTLKPLLFAIGLEIGSVTPGTLIDCEQGKWSLPTEITPMPIRDEEPLGIVPLSEAFWNSSNIGSAKTLERIVHLDAAHPDYRTLYAFLLKLGLGPDLSHAPSPSATIELKPVDQWEPSDVLNLALGIGPLKVTALRLAEAYSILANDGVVGGGPSHVTTEAGDLDACNGVLSSQIVLEVRKLLAEVVLRGRGRTAQSSSYSIAAVPGTVSKEKPDEGRETPRMLLFAGFAPVENPQVVVVTVLDEPRKARYGMETGPLFRDIIEDSLQILGCPPDLSLRP